MTDEKFQSVCKYFEKVIRESFDTENRKEKFDENKRYYTFIIEGGIIHFSVGTPFSRVTRRATYRLINNLKKNFGLIVDECRYTEDNHRYFKSTDGTIDVNFVCNRFRTCFGLFDLVDMENKYVKMKGNVIPSYRNENLVKAYYDIDEDEYRRRMEAYDKNNEDPHGDRNKDFFCHLPYNISWKKYREIYKKAFGEYPELVIDRMTPDITMITE